MKRGGAGNLGLSGQYRSGLEPHCDGVSTTSDRYGGMMMTTVMGGALRTHSELKRLTDSIALSSLDTSCGSIWRLKPQNVHLRRSQIGEL